MADDQSMVVVQLILRPGSGRRITGGTMITAANIAEFAPSTRAIDDVGDHFRRLGFEVGAFGGIALTVSAPAEVVGRTFAVQLQHSDEDGTVVVDGETAVGIHELPLDHLPRHLRDDLVAATFEPPVRVMTSTDCDDQDDEDEAEGGPTP